MAKPALPGEAFLDSLVIGRENAHRRKHRTEVTEVTEVTEGAGAYAILLSV
jgi:hypothetical protein